MADNNNGFNWTTCCFKRMQIARRSEIGAKFASAGVLRNSIVFLLLSIVFVVICKIIILHYDIIEYASRFCFLSKVLTF